MLLHAHQLNEVRIEDQPLILLAIEDITERRRSESALINSEKLASVGRMAATLAHEINNPLESVTNYIYLARQEAGGGRSRSRKFLQAMDEELLRVGHMTKQTLGLYRESTVPKPVLVSDILGGLLPMYAPKIKTRQIQTDLQIAGEREIVAARGDLRQVFSNLLSNSIDAVGVSGGITMRIAATRAAADGRKPGIRVTIADDGPGIPQANRKRIFDPFFTTKKDVGTGLGFWVSKQIVEQHGGSLRCAAAWSRARAGPLLPSSSPTGNPARRKNRNQL